MGEGNGSRSILALRSRAAAALFGLAAFSVGVVAVFATANDAGSAALVAVGTIAVAVALFGERIQTLAVAGTTITLRDAAQETLDIADKAAERGDEKAAQELREVGRELRRFADAYRLIRSEMRAGDQRTGAMDDLVEEASKLGRHAPLDPGDVSRWFERGTEGARITAIALMAGSSRLRDFSAAYDAITRSRTAFEQYWGLRLAREMVTSGSLRSYERVLLREAVDRALRSERMRGDSHRMDIATQIRDALGPRAASE